MCNYPKSSSKDYTEKNINTEVFRATVEKQVWRYNGKNFAVEVVRWSDSSTKLAKDILPPYLTNLIPDNHWNVYAYIYPKHPLFDKIISESLYDFGIDLPLHCGCSLHDWAYEKDGKVNYKKIGSDYQHPRDDEFGKCITKEDAWKIFQDADELIETLKNQDAPADTNNPDCQ